MRGNSAWIGFVVPLFDGSSPRMRGTRDRIHSPGGWAAVHPRACGELCSTWTFRMLGAGSSPRMRGTQLYPRPRQRPLRFIPAHAGNSAAALRAARLLAVHPRACGELQLSAVIFTPTTGSSPRMRGTRRRAQCSRTRTAVHPRACGELDGHIYRTVNPTGSSPRMRGTPGKTVELEASTPVHPRACGELQPISLYPLPVSGSSPRMRGTRL